MIENRVEVKDQKEQVVQVDQIVQKRGMDHLKHRVLSEVLRLTVKQSVNHYTHQDLVHFQIVNHLHIHHHHIET